MRHSPPLLTLAGIAMLLPAQKDGDVDFLLVEAGANTANLIRTQVGAVIIRQRSWS
jgi:hypothetical protein